MDDVSGISARCHCGAVHVEVARLPGYMNDCNCSFCRKSGAVWGYYPVDEVAVCGPTSSYARTDREKPAVRIHYCGQCGNTTHWTLTPQYQAQMEGAPQMGVNMRLFSAAQLSNVELRFPDGENWDGKSPYSYRRKSSILD